MQTEEATRSILVAGIGNIFFGDDGFGVEVVRRLLQRPLPAGVQVRDFGIRGFDLACAIMGGHQAVILVDAVARGGPPGSIYVIEPDIAARTEMPPPSSFAGHSLDPRQVLELVQRLGGSVPPLRLVGCEPESFGTEQQPQMELSPTVAAAIDRAIATVHEVLAELLVGSLKSSRYRPIRG